MTATVITLIATALASGIGWRGWNAPAAVRAHLSLLGALILLLIAWRYRLDALELVYSARGAVFGAGYTDVHAQLPAFTILVFVTIIAAILLLVNVFLRQAWRAIVVVLVGWVAISALAGNVYPNLVQRFQVNPNEFTREREYIAHNIEFTRAGVRAGQYRRRELRRGKRADRRRTSGPAGHDSQHPPVGLPPAAPDLQPGAGLAAAVSVYRHRHRPLRYRRRAAAADVVGPRADTGTSWSSPRRHGSTASWSTPTATEWRHRPWPRLRRTACRHLFSRTCPFRAFWR